MIAADWFALLPLIVLSVGVAILLLVVSFWRRHGLIDPSENPGIS